MFTWPPQLPDFNPTEHLWDVAKPELGVMDVPADKMDHVNMERNLWGMFPATC